MEIDTPSSRPNSSAPIWLPPVDWLGSPSQHVGRHQDPTVFEGTLRFNIDPFGEFPDARLWEAVQSVQLMPYIRTLPEPRHQDGIDTHIERDGSNISFGQKQLLSLARAMLQGSCALHGVTGDY
eukprot:Skav232679  [mRNA]  locus=scaffold698:359075:359879:+ [translate_table: standard]